MKYDSEHFVIWSRTKTVNKKIKENKTCRGNLWLICGIFHCNISTRQLRVQITTILYNYIFVNAKFVVFASIYPFLDQPLSWRNNSRRRHSNFSLLQLASFILELKLCQSLKRLSSSKYFVLDYGEAMTKKTSTVFRFPQLVFTYLLINNGNTRTVCEICLTLIIRITSEWCQKHRSDVF